MRDIILHRICKAIKKLLVETAYPIVFNYVKRTRNIAGLPLERMRRRKKEEQFIIVNQLATIRYNGFLDLS